MSLCQPQASQGTWPAFNRYLNVSFKQTSGERFRANWPLVSSPVPLAHGELLLSLDVRHALSTVRRQQLLQRTSPILLAGFLPNKAGMILTWPVLIIVQMVMVRCISR